MGEHEEALDRLENPDIKKRKPDEIYAGYVACTIVSFKLLEGRSGKYPFFRIALSDGGFYTLTGKPEVRHIPFMSLIKQLERYVGIRMPWNPDRLDHCTGLLEYTRDKKIPLIFKRSPLRYACKSYWSYRLIGPHTDLKEI